MNTFPHTHTVKVAPNSGFYGEVRYGDQTGFLHPRSYWRPSWWPDWYTRWKMDWLIKTLIRKHDQASKAQVKREVPDVVALHADEWTKKIKSGPEGWLIERQPPLV